MAAFDPAINAVSNLYANAYDQLNRIDAKADPQAFAKASIELQIAFGAANNLFQAVTTAVQSDLDAKRRAAGSAK